VDSENEYRLLVAGRGGDTGEWPANFHLRSIPLSDRVMAILWHRLRLPLPVEAFTGQVDLFHSPDFTLPPTRARAVLTVHDLSFIRVPECAAPTLRAYLGKVVPRSVRRAHLILADSQNTKDDLVNLLGLAPEKVEVLYPGVEEHFRPVDDPALLEGVRRRYGLPPRFVLSLGTLEPRKNFPRLIEAFWLLVRSSPLASSLGLVIAGGKGWLYEDIFATVERLGLEEKALFTGFVAEGDLPALYSAADLFVYPSLYEGFGLPPLEAMACGTPVVASRSSSLPEVLGEAAILVDPTDTEALAAAMMQVLEDEPLREEMRQKGLRQARKFSWSGTARRLLELYRSCLAGSPHKP